MMNKSKEVGLSSDEVRGLIRAVSVCIAIRRAQLAGNSTDWFGSGPFNEAGFREQIATGEVLIQRLYDLICSAEASENAE